jgi:hypothetical protein
MVHFGSRVGGAIAVDAAWLAIEAQKIESKAKHAIESKMEGRPRRFCIPDSLL